MKIQFGTNGVRGVVGDTMTVEIAQRLGQAVGTYLEAGQTLAIGTDARSSRDMLSSAFIAGVLSTGVHVQELGILPSPGIQLWVRDENLDFGAIVTASHNPPPDNGIKLIAPDGTETSKTEENAIEALFEAGEFRRVDWTDVGERTRTEQAREHYLQAVLDQVDVDLIRKSNLRVVLDPGGGAGCATAPELMERLGVETVRISCDFDPAFSDRPSEPTEAHAAAAIEAVVEHQADMGILQDGDADRAIFIDEQGQYVWGDQSLALAAYYELTRYEPGSKVCTAVSSSSCVQDVVDMQGGELIWTVVGSPIVARDMIRCGAVFGGEDNGGLMFTRHQICRDGLMAMAFMLELVAKTGKPLSELLEIVPRYALVKDKTKVPEDQKQTVLAALPGLLQGLDGVVSMDDRDGLKILFENGWVLVRPSGTEPIFRIQSEAKDEATARALAAPIHDALGRALTA